MSDDDPLGEVDPVLEREPGIFPTWAALALAGGLAFCGACAIIAVVVVLIGAFA